MKTAIFRAPNPSTADQRKICLQQQLFRDYLFRIFQAFIASATGIPSIVMPSMLHSAIFTLVRSIRQKYTVAERPFLENHRPLAFRSALFAGRRSDVPESASSDQCGREFDITEVDIVKPGSAEIDIIEPRPCEVEVFEFGFRHDIVFNGHFLRHWRSCHLQGCLVNGRWKKILRGRDGFFKIGAADKPFPCLPIFLPFSASHPDLPRIEHLVSKPFVESPRRQRYA
jgi:hypothetical protein